MCAVEGVQDQARMSNEQPGTGIAVGCMGIAVGGVSGENDLCQVIRIPFTPPAHRMLTNLPH